MADHAWRTGNDALTGERYALMTDRIGRIPSDRYVPEKYQDYFEKESARLLKAAEIYEKKSAGTLADRTMEECREDNEALWGHLSPGNYEKSWADPAYAVSKLGSEAGHLITFLCSEMDNCAAYAFQGKQEELTLFFELFVQVYNCMEEEDIHESIDTIYWFFHDYSDIFVEDQVRDMLCPDCNFFRDIVMNADLGDLRYLYSYGLPVGENELGMAAFLNTMSDEEIRTIADTFTEGYRLGFAAMNRDISIKKTVQLDFPVGFERVIRAAVLNFGEMGLSVTMAREPSSSFQAKGRSKRAVYSTSPNRQYDFDHREDAALYFDRAFSEHRIEALRTVMGQHSGAALLYAGPAVVEVFGEAPFSPEAKRESIHLNAEQQKLNIDQSVETGLITYTYIPAEETSFTIIAFPTPDIGPRFEEIFSDTVRINTLDYRKYRRIQQRLIDVLDGAKEVRVLGQGDNRTDITVAIRQPEDPERETAFENCVADVNIPVGEVFTSPVLEGTNGVLHVTDIFLNGLRYRDLEITFKDGMISDYGCANFDSDGQNRRYVKDNVMSRYETLPMGEFSIGTNTTAYAMAKRYGIGDRMPILIAEKTGPHFAVGDTCYSREEDVPTYNPDGKRIAAKENEVSAMREEDPAGAYFNWHLDITIPYDELGTVTAVCPDGSSVDIIRDGLFLVEGTEELNEPLAELRSGRDPGDR